METQPTSILKRTEDLFFLMQHNLTTDAKNTVWHFLELAKEAYPKSSHQNDWDAMLENLQKLIMDFANESSVASEMKLLAIHRAAIDMKKQHEKPTEEN